ncbi:MAG: SLC13 family permease [Clostridium sp.]|nr:SLC13 family permease [Clostridium sp.]
MLQDSTIAIIILIVIIISFATQIVPISVTAVMGALLMMVFGIITPAEAVSSFGSDTVLMVVGVMIIGNAVYETRLAAKIGHGIIGLKWVGNSERLFLLIVLVLVSMLSAFMSNTAAVAIFMPLVEASAMASKGHIKTKNIFMAMGIASILGGNCTLSGSTPQLIAQGILGETQGARLLGFFELSSVGIPLIAIMVIYFMTVGYVLQKKVFDFPEHEGKRSGETLPPPEGHKDMICAVILILCIIGFTSGIYSLGAIALFCGCMCIITGCISQKRAFETMDWTTVAVLGGALGFAKGLNASGAATVITHKLLGVFGGSAASPMVLCAVLIIAASLLGNVMSHTATVAVMVPIGISIAQFTGSDPIPFVVGIVIGCNLSFVTPVGTPPMTMTLTGGYRFADYAKVGGPLNAVCVAAACVLVPILAV